MHWPIGAPRLYEQILLPAPKERSHDGLDAIDETKDGTVGASDQDQVGCLRRSTDAHRTHAPADREPVSCVGEDYTNSTRKDPSTTTEKEHDKVLLSKDREDDIIAIRVTRNGHLFATITAISIAIWQTKPTAIVAAITRSKRSIYTYGHNVGLLLRPDGTFLAVCTSRGYLITYSVLRAFDAPAYQLVFPEGNRRHTKRRGVNHSSGYGEKEENSILDGSGLFHRGEVHFRMVIRIDAGIEEALALDNEIVIATKNPPAVQCIKWIPDRLGSPSTNQLLSSIKWLQGRVCLERIIFDKPMSLFTWITSDGQVYAVQQKAEGRKESQNLSGWFNGHIFHKPDVDEARAMHASINSRFSLIAVGCRSGTVCIYTVRDYSGGITVLEELAPPISALSSGRLTTLSYSPDGYCLFAGYEKGWVSWSVYGQISGSSFSSERLLAEQTDEPWLTGVQDACWMASGVEVALVCPQSYRIYLLEFARSAVTGCFASANIERGLLQTSEGLMVYQGHGKSDLTTITTDVSLWLRVQYPIHYLLEQWPIRSAVISSDGHYLAIAGQRGLAHYSISSGRWKTFEDPSLQDEFFVRGGMCWYHHVLIVAVESSTSHEVRLYSREHPLDNSNILQVVKLDAAVVHLALSGEDSILVYTQANILNHYIVAASKRSVKLLKVGQIALHGIIRSPSRVRSVCWIIPDDQLQYGDPSQDVAVASVVFLIDGKLVLLQPSTTEAGDLKYEMRFIGHEVEYYVFARDQAGFEVLDSVTSPGSSDTCGLNGRSLCDSLWTFDGSNIKVWTDVHDLLLPGSTDTGRELSEPVSIPVDFYPFSPLLQKGILIGIEGELAQRRDSFSSFRIIDRTTLFLPNILRHHLSSYDTSAALRLSHAFRHLPYFAHALEVLLHTVLDEEVDRLPDKEHSMLPAVLAFLSTFPEYLDIVVQCTRKTEVRSWQTLFAHLPPPNELFEASLAKGDLKTAGGYLLVLHTLAEINSDAPEVVRLLRAARQEQDWELCKELARFLMALDESGATLEKALRMMDLDESASATATSPRARGQQERQLTVVQRLGDAEISSSNEGSNRNKAGGRPGASRSHSNSYFSALT